MRKYINLIVLILLWLPIPAFAWTAGTCILGPGDGSSGSNVSSDNLSSTGQNRDDLWKAFRWKAGGSGDAYVFRMRVGQINSTGTSHNVAFCVYADASGPKPGTMMFSGNVSNYNWETIGVGVHYFDIDTVYTTRTITAGNYYWLAVRTSTSSDNTLWFDRQSSETLPDWANNNMKIMSNILSNPSTYPNWASSYSGYYADNYYGWSVWTASNSGPSVSSTSGPWIHGNNVTVTGSGFGTKNPAAPIVWDDCTNNPPLNTYYDEFLPANAEQGSQYNMAYRDASFRGIGSPDGRIRYILGGAHAISHHANTYYRGGNVSVGVNLRSFNFFTHYWYRVDPNFDEEAHPSYGDNMKELCLSGAEGEIYGGNWGYYAYCTSHVPDVNFTSPTRLERIPVDDPDSPYACSQDAYVTTHNNPINGWIKMQWEGGYNNTYDNPTVRWTTYPDGNVTDLSHYGNEITTYEILTGAGNPDAGELRFLGLGGFARIERENNGRNSFRYFAGVYIDVTHSRVMLGDNSDYGSCTKMEPQIPFEWSNGSITVRVNLGNFHDSGTAYLFVFDENNNRNPVGYPVTVSGAPSPPKNLRIIDIS